MNQTFRFTDDGLWVQTLESHVKIGLAKQLFHKLFPPSRCADPGYTIHDALIHLIHLELPILGNSYQEGDEFGVLEAEKAAIGFVSPATGVVTMLNELPSKLGELYCEPSPDTWLVELKISP